MNDLLNGVALGWRKTVGELLQDLATLEMPNFQVTEISDNGGLKLHLIGVPERYRTSVNSLIQEATTKCLGTCQICGDHGTRMLNVYAPDVTLILCEKNCSYKRAKEKKEI